MKTTIIHLLTLLCSDTIQRFYSHTGAYKGFYNSTFGDEYFQGATTLTNPEGWGAQPP